MLIFFHAVADWRLRKAAMLGAMKDPSFQKKSGTYAVPRVDRVLAGGGDAGALARAVDWSKTAIGPVEGWSQALRSAAALVLHNE